MVLKSVTGICAKFPSFNRIPIEYKFLMCRLQCLLKPVIVDIGCGRGDKTLYLSNAVRHNCGFLIMLDLDIDLLKHVKTMLGFDNPHIDIVHCDAQLLPFRSNSIDIALLWNVLMFIFNDKQALLEAFRILKRNGLIVISVYNVKTGFRNYDLIKLLRLIAFKFMPISIRIPTKDQLIVFAQKISSESVYKVLRVPLSKLIPIIKDEIADEELYVNANKFNGLYAYVLIPKSQGLEKELRPAERSKSSFLLKTYTVLLTFFNASIGKIVEFLEIIPKGKCIFQSDELRSKLLSLGVPKTALNKAINDLARLGILRRSMVLVETLRLCDYMPSLAPENSVSLNPIVFWYMHYTSPIKYDNVIGIAILTGNPILREAFNTMYTEYSGIVSISEFAKILRNMIYEYWTKCYGIDNSYVNQILELKKLVNKTEVHERIITVLNKLGLIHKEQEKISLTNMLMKLLDFIRY